MPIVKMLIAKGVNDWKWGLHFACMGRHVNIASLMLENTDIDCYSFFIDDLTFLVDTGRKEFEKYKPEIDKYKPDIKIR